MQTQHSNIVSAEQPWSVLHTVSSKDAGALAAARQYTDPMKGLLRGPQVRPVYDEIMGGVIAPEGVSFEEDTIGGIHGWWCRPQNVQTEGVILHLHGGWFMWGTANAYRNFVGQIASRAGVPTFVADYRLAPEHPFPAAILDAESAYRGLIARGFHRITISGDSAGGSLGLALAKLLVGSTEVGGIEPVGIAALSPVTDLALKGQSWTTRANADPYFTLEQAKGLVGAYLGGHDSKDPLASPLYGDLAGLPPIRVFVGEDEVLLDDSRRYVEKAVAAGVDAQVDIWQGAPHVFQNRVGQLDAAAESLDLIGEFLSARLQPTLI